MHSKYGKAGGMGCLGPGALGKLEGTGQTGGTGTQVGWDAWGYEAPGWDGAPGRNGVPRRDRALLLRPLQPGRGLQRGCRAGKGLTGFGYPPLC